MELPPAPPPPPDPWLSGGAPAPKRPAGRRLVLIAALVLLAGGGIALVAFFAQSSGNGFPETVLGFERIRGGQAQQVEDAMGEIRIGDIEVHAAVYGESGRPRLLAATYENYPAGPTVEAIIQGAAGGAEASGGTVDDASLQVSESEGYRFACMSGRGPGFLVPGGPSEEGVLCVFQGELVGLVVTTHTTEPVLGLMDVRAFVEAYEAA